MRSILELAKELFNIEQPLKYFLPYKCSQDHLELFFSSIRSRGGWNNNPNTLQLRWALRQLLFKNSFKSSASTNCCDFNVTESITAFQFTNQGMNENKENENNELFLTYAFHELEDHSSSYYIENVLYYISGFVTKK